MWHFQISFYQRYLRIQLAFFPNRFSIRVIRGFSWLFLKSVFYQRYPRIKYLL